MGISVKSGVKFFLYVWDFYNRCYASLDTLTLAYSFFGLFLATRVHVSCLSRCSKLGKWRGHKYFDDKRTLRNIFYFKSHG